MAKKEVWAERSAISKIGEDAIYKVLNRHGHHAEIVPFGTEEEQFLQNNGCDILETWTDKAGNPHVNWNEIKTERPTLSKNYHFPNVKPLWKLFRHAIEVDEEGGTGNAFIEFLQTVPKDKKYKASQTELLKIAESNYSGRGWYPKYYEFEQQAEQKPFDEHYIWFVFRVNPDIVMEKDVVSIYKDGSMQVNDWMTGGGCVAIKTTMRRLIEVVEAGRNKYRYTCGDKGSWGMLLPLKDIWWIEDEDAMKFDEDTNLAIVPGDDGKAWFYDVGTITGGNIDLMPEKEK